MLNSSKAAAVLKRLKSGLYNHRANASHSMVIVSSTRLQLSVHRFSGRPTRVLSQLYAHACYTTISVSHWVLYNRVYTGWSEVTSQNLWSRYDRHFVGMKCHNECLFKEVSIWSLTPQESLFNRYLCGKHFSELCPQDGAENQLA